MAQKKVRLSVALATYNEEATLSDCLESVKTIASEIVIVDGGSTDHTREVAKSFSAKVIVTGNPPIFHINKQKALDACGGDWILQLDADERVSLPLAEEIISVLAMTSEQIENRTIEERKRKLFQRHQATVENRDGPVGTPAEDIVAFFIPRRNYFLGKFLRFAGTYPDGVIRLFKKGKAWFPAQSVHEQIQVDGKVAWLTHDLLHISNLTLKKYLTGADKYTSLLADSFRSKGVKVNIFSVIDYCFLRPTKHFLYLFLRHKGILDGVQGFLFCLFSALHFPVAFVKYAMNP